jgi:hypothetical protein
VAVVLAALCRAWTTASGPRAAISRAAPLRFGPDHDGGLNERPLDRGKATGQVSRGHPVVPRLQKRRLMVEPTSKIGVGGSNLRERVNLERASVKQKQVMGLG